jgi:hypothetical protein
VVPQKCDDGLGLSYEDYELTCQPPCGVVGTPSCLDTSALSYLHEYMLKKSMLDDDLASEYTLPSDMFAL